MSSEMSSENGMGSERRHKQVTAVASDASEINELPADEAVDTVEASKDSSVAVADAESLAGEENTAPFSDFIAEPEELDDISPSAADDTFPLAARIGALLFVATRPLTIQNLQELSKSSTGKLAHIDEIDAAIEELRATYEITRCGVSLVEVAGAYQLRTAPELGRTVQRLIPPRARRLSKAAAETLAIVAYKQPIQRAEIESVRGVDAAPTLKTLLEAKLVRVVGREDTVGQPALYGTTTTFLEKFGLRDLTELPSVREISRITSDPGEAQSASAEDESNGESENVTPENGVADNGDSPVSSEQVAEPEAVEEELM